MTRTGLSATDSELVRFWLDLADVLNYNMASPKASLLDSVHVATEFLLKLASSCHQLISLAVI